MPPLFLLPLVDVVAVAVAAGVMVAEAAATVAVAVASAAAVSASEAVLMSPSRLSTLAVLKKPTPALPALIEVVPAAWSAAAWAFLASVMVYALPVSTI